MRGGGGVEGGCDAVRRGTRLDGAGASNVKIYFRLVTYSNRFQLQP